MEGTSPSETQIKNAKQLQDREAQEQFKMVVFRNVLAFGLLGIAFANPVELQRRAVTVTA